MEDCWTIGDTGTVYYAAKKGAKPKQYHVRITAWDEDDSPDEDGSSKMWVQVSSRKDNSQQFPVNTCDFTLDEKHTPDETKTKKRKETAAKAPDAVEKKPKKTDSVENRVAQVDDETKESKKKKKEAGKAGKLDTKTEQRQGREKLAAKAAEKARKDAGDEPGAGLADGAQADPKHTALTAALRGGQPTPGRAGGRGGGQGGRGRTAEPPRATQVHEFISCNHQSEPVVVNPAEAMKCSTLWSKEVVTYLKLTKRFAREWLTTPETYLIAAVMRRRYGPDLNWSDAEELQSTPTNIYLQLKADGNGFKVSAVKQAQDREVGRIDRPDLYKHRARCFTGAPSCVQ